jgi:hypothetical protein
MAAPARSLLAVLDAGIVMVVGQLDDVRAGGEDDRG